MVDVPRREHLYPTVTPTSSQVGSFDSRHQDEDEIETSSIETYPTITASEANYVGILDRQLEP